MTENKILKETVRRWKRLAVIRTGIIDELQSGARNRIIRRLRKKEEAEVRAIDLLMKHPTPADSASGSIAEPVVWNAALNQEEITALAAGKEDQDREGDWEDETSD